MGDADMTEMQKLMAMMTNLTKGQADMAGKVDGVKTDIGNVRKDVAAIGARVENLEKGKKPKPTPESGESTSSTVPPVAQDATASEKKDVEKDKQVTTPAKSGPITVKKLSPSSEDSWAKRAAIISDTPKLDAMLSGIPAGDPVLEDLPFIKPRVNQNHKRKDPEPAKMADYDLNRCQILSSVMELEKLVIRDSTGRGAVRGARANKASKLTEIRKIMSSMGVKDPRDNRQKSMIDGETVPDGRVNIAFDLAALDRMNKFLQEEGEHGEELQ